MARNKFKLVQTLNEKGEASLLWINVDRIELIEEVGEVHVKGGWMVIPGEIKDSVNAFELTLTSGRTVRVPLDTVGVALFELLGIPDDPPSEPRAG